MSAKQLKTKKKMLPHPLTNFAIQKYYQNELKFNSVYSRNNLPKIEGGTYVINLDEYKSIGTQWKALYINGDNGGASHDVIYFDSFGVEHISKDVQKFIRTKNIITNIYGIQPYDSIMCGYFCIGFVVDFMLKGKTLLDYKNYFLLTNMERMIK